MPTQQELAILIDTHINTGENLVPTTPVGRRGLEVSSDDLAVLAEATSAYMEIVRGATPRDGVIEGSVPSATAWKPEVLGLNQPRFDAESLAAIDEMPRSKVSPRARAVTHKAAEILARLQKTPNMILVRLADGVDPARIDPVFEGTTVDDKVVMTNARLVGASRITDMAREGSYSDWGNRPEVEADLAVAVEFETLNGQTVQATFVGQAARIVQMGIGLAAGKTPHKRQEEALRPGQGVDVKTFAEYYELPIANRTWPNRTPEEVRELLDNLRSNYPSAPELPQAAIALEAGGFAGLRQHLETAGRGGPGGLV